jgi:uncharacterized protein
MEGISWAMGKWIIYVILLCLQGCSGLFYYPTRVLYSDPEQRGIPFENIHFDSIDGTRLHGWYLPPVEGVPVRELVVFFHGNAQNITSHYVGLEWVREAGLGLFIFDYRGYGLSEGSPNQQGLFKDGMKALSVARELKERHQHTAIIAYGQSLGGAVLARVLEEHDPEHFKLVVLDSTFLSYQAIARRKIRDSWLLWPLRPFLPILISDEFAATRFKAHWTGPALVIVGKQDEVVEPEFGEGIFQGLASEKKWLWRLENGRHIDVYFVDEGRYRSELLELIQSL